MQAIPPRPTFLAFALAAPLAFGVAGCAGRQTASYLVKVEDRVHGRMVEGATVEARDGGASLSAPSATGTTDPRGETVIIVPGWGRADLFITFDGETERYWFPPARTPGHEAPRAQIEGEQSTVHFITGPKPDPVWKVTVVRIQNVIR